MPEEWIVSKVCEEFHCLPAEAVDALENDVNGMIFKIIEFRAYKNAKEIYDKAEPDKRPSGAVFDRVRDMTFELARERIEKADHG